MFLILFCLLHSFILSSTNGFNITEILGQYPNFSTFNNHLSETQVADQINGRNTLTILAVDNAGMAPLSGKSPDEIKMVMGLHVVLDYYDVHKLQRMKNKTVILTTLYQSSGLARGQTGFLNATLLHTGSVAIGSAEQGSKLNSNLVKSVFSSPYNVSVLQVSGVIMPPSVAGPVGPTPPAPAPMHPPRNPTGPPTKAPTPSGTMPMPIPLPMPPGKAPGPVMASPPAPPGGGAGSNNSAGAPGPIMASPPRPPGGGAGSNNSAGAPGPTMASPPGPPGGGAGSNNSAGAPGPTMASPPGPPGGGAGSNNSAGAPGPTMASPPGGGAGSNNSAGAPGPTMASPPGPPGGGAGAGNGFVPAPAPVPAAHDPVADAPQGGTEPDKKNNSSATVEVGCTHVLVVFLSLLSILCFGSMT